MHHNEDPKIRIQIQLPTLNPPHRDLTAQSHPALQSPPRDTTAPCDSKIELPVGPTLSAPNEYPSGSDGPDQPAIQIGPPRPLFPRSKATI